MTNELHTFASLNLTEMDLFSSLNRCLTPKLEKIHGKKVIFCKDDANLVPSGGWGTRSSPYCATTINTIKPIKEGTLVAAVDSSSIQVAETEDGGLYAVKCGVAMAYSGRPMMHFKIGPMLFYLDQETIASSELDHRLAKLVLFDSDAARRLIRVRIERSIQREISSHFTHSVILVDGSLKTSLFEDRRNNINKIVEDCALHKNLIMGISKSTKIKILDQIATPLTKMPGPGYVEVDMIIKSLIRNTIGNNLLVKFENNSPVLRADVSGNVDESLGRLLGNDSLAGGYPGTLRLAHHVSTFTNTEATCLRSHVLNNYDVTELPAEDIRRTLLGSIPV